MKLTGIKAVFFDFDDTLGDREYYAYECAKTILKKSTDIKDPIVFESILQDWMLWDEKGTFKIATSSAGSPLKGYDVLGVIVNELKEEGLPVEVVSLTEMNNAQVLEKKLDCHATFTSIHGGWGMSGVESMFLGHPILCSLDPWVMSLFPNNPTVVINRANLKQSIKDMVNMPRLTQAIGEGKQEAWNSPLKI